MRTDERRSDLSGGPRSAPARTARIFVGIKIADEVAQRLAQLASPLAQHHARLVAPADIHLTLVPPWNEINTAEAIDTLRAAVGNLKPFPLKLTRLGYGPTLRNPRLRWVECAASKDLEDLRNALLTAYGTSDPRPFLPHITVARMPRNGRTIARRNPVRRAVSLAATRATRLSGFGLARIRTEAGPRGGRFSSSL